MSDTLTLPGNGEEQVFQQVREILSSARRNFWRAANTAMVSFYWEIGRVIVEEEQRGAERAGYGKRLLESLSKRLSAEFCKGFDPSNLRYMRLFFQAFPIRDALRHELTWTHYRLLVRIENLQARSFYEQELADASGGDG